MFWLSCSTLKYQGRSLGTMSDTQRWMLSYTCLNSPCCNLSSVHHCWSLMRVVGVLDPIPADRRQENTKTVHRPTQTGCSYAPTMRVRSTDGQTFGRNQKSWRKPKTGRTGTHTETEPLHGDSTSLATPVCIKKHTFVSHQGGPWKFNSKYLPASVVVEKGFPAGKSFKNVDSPLQFLTFLCKLQCLCYYRDHR